MEGGGIRRASTSLSVHGSKVHGDLLHCSDDHRYDKNHFGQMDWKSHEGDYEFLRVVGKGAFGTASLYRKQPDNGLVVIKEISMHDLNATDRVLAIREADLLSSSDHPNIVHYINKYENQGNLMIEMEYCDGGTLADFLAQLSKPLKEHEILIIFQQIVSAISYLHDRNIIHRDLKTANIFITQKTVIKVGDLGIAKVVTTINPYASSVIGTPLYISPEMCEGKRYDKKTDIWALGCILYEVTSLHKTFEGSNLPALINKIVKVKYAPIRASYSDNLRQLITDLLQKDPERRPYAYEVHDTVSDLLYKSQVDRYATTDMLKSNIELFSGAITNGIGLGLHRFQSSFKHTRSIVYQVHLQERHVSITRIEFPQLHRIKHMSKGKNHFLAVTNSLEVCVWGSNSNGQLGLGTRVIKNIDKPTVIESVRRNIAKAVAGDCFSIFLSNNGLVMSCGKVSSGCLGNPVKNDCYEPKLVDNLITIDVQDICCGQRHVSALSKFGEVYSWGENKDGRLGVELDFDQSSSQLVQIPSLVKFPSGVKIEKIFCGDDCSLFIDDKGVAWACGSNKNNRLGLDESTMRRVTKVEQCALPERVKMVKFPIETVHVGPRNVCYLFKDGKVLVLGSNEDAQMGCGHATQVQRPVWIRQMVDHSVTNVHCGSSFILVTTLKNELYFWGSRYYSDSEKVSKSFADIRNSNSSDQLCSEGECSLKNPEHIKIGATNMTLMSIVEKIGPDFPVLQIKDPRVIIDNFKQLKLLPSCENGIRCDIILKPQAIVALYCSQVHLQYGETIILADSYCFDDENIFIVFDTTISMNSSTTKGDAAAPPSSVSSTLVPEKMRMSVKSFEHNATVNLRTEELNSPPRSPVPKRFYETTEIPDWIKSVGFIDNDQSNGQSKFELSRTGCMDINEPMARKPRPHSFPLLSDKETEKLSLLMEVNELQMRLDGYEEKLLMCENHNRELQNEVSRLRRRQNVKTRRCVIS